jgi:nucleotide-binding universal stress UspA family protein
VANPAAFVARAREVLASLPPEKWEHIEKGRIYLADGGMIASVREQVPDGIDPDGDDPEAWEIGDAAVEEAERRAEAVVLLVNARVALLDVVEAAMESRRADQAFLSAPITTLAEPHARLVQAGAALDAALAALEVPE